MKRPSNKPSFSRADDDPLTRFAGPSETVAASVPRALTAAIRAKVGKREFSGFVVVPWHVNWSTRTALRMWLRSRKTMGRLIHS
jgi:hypothetical protein